MTKPELINFFNQNAAAAHQRHQRNRFYYNDLKSFFKFNIRAGARVLEIGSGTGQLLAAVQPQRGLGLDLSEEAVNIAQKKYPHLEFRVADIDQPLKFKETFDYIILSDLVGFLEDIQTSFKNLRPVCHSGTRVIVNQYNNLWWPILKIGEALGLKQREPIANWIDGEDVINLMDLAGFEVIKRGRRLLFPKYFPLVSWFFNRIMANLPILNYFCLVQYFILRCRPVNADEEFSVSVVIPARNEKENISEAVRRLPAMGKHTEIIFIEGHSTDGTLEEIKKVTEDYKQKRDIKFFVQGGKGKSDAVRKGFSQASGDILIILDADLTVPPEALPKFYEVMASRRAEYVQGTRLIYPMEGRAMRFLNYLANKFFGASFSWLLGQYITDTLCGTKVLFKKDYQHIAAGRKFFGDFDPFGDFDLIFGVSKLNLKLAELPIHYKERKYGETNISRFKHGLILIKMLWIGIKKFKLT